MLRKYNLTKMERIFSSNVDLIEITFKVTLDFFIHYKLEITKFKFNSTFMEMKTLSTFLLITLVMATQLFSQESELPYHQIPDYPDSYTANHVAVRMVDGLGFRYYWATKDLRAEDLDYRISEDSRTSRETLEHIYGLSRTIMHGPQSKVNTYPKEELSFDELRKRTLENIAFTSKLLKEGKEGDMDRYLMIFQRGDTTTEYPFWNMINGPIEDAVYHTGQIVAYRRASGNPIQKGVRMLTGKTAE